MLNRMRPTEPHLPVTLHRMRIWRDHRVPAETTPAPLFHFRERRQARSRNLACAFLIPQTWSNFQHLCLPLRHRKWSEREARTARLRLLLSNHPKPGGDLCNFAVPVNRSSGLDLKGNAPSRFL